jgi:hypothetical protein
MMAEEMRERNQCKKDEWKVGAESEIIELTVSFVCERLFGLGERTLPNEKTTVQ